MNKLTQQINQVLAEIRPSLQAHSGDVALVSFEKGIVTLKVAGACVGCPMAAATFNQGVGQILKNKIPGVKTVRYV